MPPPTTTTSYFLRGGGARKTTWTRFRRSIRIDWGLELTNYKLGATRTCSDDYKLAAAAASLIVAARNDLPIFSVQTIVPG